MLAPEQIDLLRHPSLDRPMPAGGRAFEKESNRQMLELLNRYEAQLERMLYSALKQLRSL